MGKVRDRSEQDSQYLLNLNPGGKKISWEKQCRAHYPAFERTIQQFANSQRKRGPSEQGERKASKWLVKGGNKKKKGRSVNRD